MEEDKDFNVSRITPRLIAGKDTDWLVSREIIHEVTKVCNHGDDPGFRLFVGGDQKTMGVLLRLKKHWSKEFKHVYVGIPDLHLRKCMLHAVFKRYGILGLQHLATCTGFQTAEQWDFLESVRSIPKSFVFCERVLYSMQIAFYHEFLRSLNEEQRTDVLKILITPDENEHNETVLPLCAQYIYMMVLKMKHGLKILK